MPNGARHKSGAYIIPDKLAIHIPGRAIDILSWHEAIVSHSHYLNYILLIRGQHSSVGSRVRCHHLFFQINCGPYVHRNQSMRPIQACSLTFPRWELLFIDGRMACHPNAVFVSLFD